MFKRKTLRKICGKRFKIYCLYILLLLKGCFFDSGIASFDSLFIACSLLAFDSFDSFVKQKSRKNDPTEGRTSPMTNKGTGLGENVEVFTTLEFFWKL